MALVADVVAVVRCIVAAVVCNLAATVVTQVIGIVAVGMIADGHGAAVVTGMIGVLIIMGIVAGAVHSTCAVGITDVILACVAADGHISCAALVAGVVTVVVCIVAALSGLTAVCTQMVSICIAVFVGIVAGAVHITCAVSITDVILTFVAASGYILSTALVALMVAVVVCIVTILANTTLAIITHVIGIGAIGMLTDGFGAVIVTDMIGVLISMGIVTGVVHGTCAVGITDVILGFAVTASGHIFCAAVIALVVAIVRCIATSSHVLSAAIITLVVAIVRCIAADGHVSCAAIITLVVAIVRCIAAGGHVLSAALVTVMVAIVRCVAAGSHVLSTTLVALVVAIVVRIVAASVSNLTAAVVTQVVGILAVGMLALIYITAVVTCVIFIVILVVQVECLAADCASQILTTGNTLSTGMVACADLVVGIADPLAIFILVGIGAAQAGIQHGTVRILQFGRLDTDPNKILGFAVRTSLEQLIGARFSTGGSNHLTGSGGVNIRAIHRGIDSAFSCIDGTVNTNLRILLQALGVNRAACGRGVPQFFIVLTGMHKICLSTGICNTLLAGPVRPGVGNDPDILCNGAGRAILDDQLRAGQQADILRHRYITGLCRHRHVAGDGQVEVRGVNGGTAQACQPHRHCDGADRDIALNCKFRSAGRLIEVFHDRSAVQRKHSAFGTNDSHITGLHAKQCNRNRHSRFLDSTCLQGQGHLDILQIVLGHGEYRMGLIGSHGGGNIAAAVVRNLEGFIDLCAAFRGYGTGTGDIAPGIQGSPAIDGNGTAGFHMDSASRSGNTTVVAVFHFCTLAAAHRNRTVYGNLRTARHGQRTINTGF